jgi:hypothetical protein
MTHTCYIRVAGNHWTCAARRMRDKHMKAIQALLTIGGAILMLSACGASSATSTPTRPAPTPTAEATPPPTPIPTLSPVALREDYLALVAPYNVAIDTSYKHYDKLPNYPSQKQLDAVCAPMASATQAYIDGVLRIPWQPSMLADVHALATAAGLFNADLNNDGNPTVSAWSTKLLQDNSTASTAANVLRADLRLPPPPK